ncbi:MAG TPA: methionine--tRNA ligase [Coleofasciculaceae cyanobacterium]
MVATEQSPLAPQPHPNSPFTVTTPLYYVNAMPHIGSAYTTMAVDAVSRFYRLQGQPVLMITGTDEHGQKIERTAQEQGRSPQEHCDEIVSGFTNLWEKLNIRCDRFIRTTDARHQAIVAEFFQRVFEAGDIYSGKQQGWYCVSCEEFKEERELTEDHHCLIHTNKAAEWRDEENYFFRLSKYQEKLQEFYANHPTFIQPDSRRNEVLAFVERGLQDFSVSRVNVDWGFPLPNDPKHTIYVWFDALLGYVTALLEPEDQPTLENALKRWWPIHSHILGKDILRFHAIYWPAMLMSAGLPIPQRLFGHGFLTKDGHKMGKTLGNTIDPFELLDRYGSDAVRYYFLKEIEFGRDGDFNESRFINIVNADLANDLGNLLNRTLRMTHKYCGGVVPMVTVADADPLRVLGSSLGDRVAQAFQSLAIHEACHGVLMLAQAGNKYLDERAPWTKFKQGDRAAVEEILYAVLESVRLAAYWLSPVVPHLSGAIYAQLGFAVDFDAVGTDPTVLDRLAGHGSWGRLPAGQPLAEPQPVFQKLELPT